MHSDYLHHFNANIYKDVWMWAYSKFGSLSLSLNLTVINHKNTWNNFVKWNWIYLSHICAEQQISFIKFNRMNALQSIKILFTVQIERYFLICEWIVLFFLFSFILCVCVIYNGFDIYFCGLNWIKFTIKNLCIAWCSWFSIQIWMAADTIQLYKCSTLAKHESELF